VGALPAILADRAPWYVRYNGAPPALTHREPVTLGRAEVLSCGDRVAILTYGFLLGEAEKARRLLESRGLPVRLLNLRTLKPLDEAAVLAAAREASLLVTLEDHFLAGGLYSILAELLLRHRLAPRVVSLAFEERWFTPALLGDVLAHEGLTGERIAQPILGALPGKES